MGLHWVSEDGAFHSARRSLGGTGTVHAAVESLGDAGWDWHVWDAAGRVRPRYDLADTLDEAKERADRASAELLAALADQLSNHAELCHKVRRQALRRREAEASAISRSASCPATGRVAGPRQGGRGVGSR